MKKSDLIIATISWTRNDEEEKALRTSLQQLAELDIRVCITDGGSNGSFLNFLHSIPYFTIRQAKGLWPQARLSITTAMESGANYIFYTEPDKLDFFSTHLKQMLDAVKIEEVGVILASRSPKGFSSFPAFQQMTETTINNCCKEVIGKEMDYCYGPFLFNCGLVPYLKLLDDNIGWGWRSFVFAIAHRLGLRVENYEGDFVCPSDQQEDDKAERIYRMKQLTQNINGLTQAAMLELQNK